MKDNSHIAAAAICVAAVLLCVYLISVAYRRTRRKINRLMNSTEARLVREVVKAIGEGEELSETTPKSLSAMTNLYLPQILRDFPEFNWEEMREMVERAVKEYLDAGQDVAMLNIGDVSIYATFGYLQEILQAGGYATAMAAGVPSFCAAAARLNVPLTGGMDTPLTIAPGGWTDRVLEMPGTKVLMKAGRQLPVLLDTLQQADKLKKSALVCNCGLPDERVYPDLSLERPQEQAGYFATVLVKE